MNCNCDDIIIEVPVEEVIIEVTPEGKDGNGIASIELLSTVGRVKTYRIHFTNGTHYDYQVSDGAQGDPGPAGKDGKDGKDGVSIVSVYKTGQTGLVDEYTILLSNGNTDTFTVTNGAPGTAATIAVGTVTTLPAGSPATVENAGTSSAAVFNFGIPQGESGASTWGSITGTLSDQADLQAALNNKADIIHSTASGSIVSITDGAVYPVDSLAVAVEPVQDLHGYTNPWPAGGGKNLLPMTVAQFKSSNVNGTWSSNTYSINGIDYTLNTDSANNITSIKVNGTATNDAYIYFMTQDDLLVMEAGSYASFISTTNVNITLQIRIGSAAGQDVMGGTTTHREATISEQTSVIARLRVPNETVISNVTVYPMLAKQATALTASDFAPYSNICPISGHTQAVIQRSGRNIAKPEAYYTSSTTLFVEPPSGASVTQTATGWSYNDNSTGHGVTVLIGYVLKGQTVTISATASTNLYRILYSTTKPTTENITATNFQSIGNNNGVWTFTATADGYYWAAFYKSGQTLPVTIDYFQSEYGSTAHPYQPYQPIISLTIPFGQTVYGAQYDVLAGRLLVDRAEYDLGDNNWASNSNGFMYSSGIMDLVKKPALSTEIVEGLICSHLEAKTANAVYNGNTGIGIHTNGTIRARYEGMSTTPSTFKSDVTGWKLVYPLEEPITIELDPETLFLLLGENNLWASTGATTLGYRADTKLYIDGKLSALKAELQALILENS